MALSFGKPSENIEIAEEIVEKDQTEDESDNG
jgi:hypothetical protein